jgi:hypothetical protein
MHECFFKNLFSYFIFPPKNKINQSSKRNKDGYQYPDEFVIAIEFAPNNIHNGENHEKPKEKYRHLPRK